MSQSVEPDFQPLFAAESTPTRILGRAIEILREPAGAQPPEHVLFDFDGTLSLIREGWVDIMLPLMVESLEATGTHESREDLMRISREFVMELTGKQTIYQFMRLADEIRDRGGKPQDPLIYKQVYHDRLMARIASRREQLRVGSASPDSMLVPGSRELLDGLRSRGVPLYLASGTDIRYVREEVELLQLKAYFGDHIYGALEDYRSFSKAMVIDKILADCRIPGQKLAGFGDGYVEIQNVRAVGGRTIAVASDEAARSGRPDEWKRSRLIAAGADIVVPDYQEYQTLIEYLWSS